MAEPNHKGANIGYYTNSSPHCVYPHFNNGVNDEVITDNNSMLGGPGTASMLFADGHASAMTPGELAQTDWIAFNKTQAPYYTTVKVTKYLVPGETSYRTP